MEYFRLLKEERKRTKTIEYLTYDYNELLKLIRNDKKSMDKFELSEIKFKLIVDFYLPEK